MKNVFACKNLVISHIFVGTGGRRGGIKKGQNDLREGRGGEELLNTSCF
jgi:hypothetical protein